MRRRSVRCRSRSRSGRVGEPGDAADVAQEPGRLEGPSRATPNSVESGAPARAAILLAGFELAVDACQLGQQLGGESGGYYRRCRGAWWPRAGLGLGPRTGIFFAPPGTRSISRRWNRLMAWVRAPPSSSRRSASRPSATRSGVTSGGAGRGSQRSQSDRVRVDGVGLAAVAGGEDPDLHRKLGKRSSTVSPSATSRCAMCSPHRCSPQSPRRRDKPRPAEHTA